MELYEKLNDEFGFEYKDNKSIDTVQIIIEHKLSEDIIEELIKNNNFHSSLDNSLNIIVSHQNLSENFIEKYIKILNGVLVSTYQKLSEDFIEKYSVYLDWLEISRFQTLSEHFIEKNIDKLFLNYVCENVEFSENFIKRYYKNFNLQTLCKKVSLSEKFIENHLDYLDIYLISKYQKLSENFIDKYKENLDWREICIYQKLSEDFIENHLDYIWWDEIFKYQKLSNNFISKYYEKSSFVIVANYNKINENLIRNNEELLNMYDIISEYNWLYKSTEEKKKAVIDTGKYECYDDYFIAYKAVRKDRHSLYNLQYKYKKGCIYESSCDCTPDENSFGLNVGTEDFSNRYGFLYSNYILIRCKVCYEDVGRVVHSGDKIRCFKIEIMD